MTASRQKRPLDREYAHDENLGEGTVICLRTRVGKPGMDTTARHVESWRLNNFVQALSTTSRANRSSQIPSFRTFRSGSRAECSARSTVPSFLGRQRSARQLTEAEAQWARDFLAIREKPWPRRFELTSEAILYLDELAVSYLQHLRLLPKLRAAGFTAVLSPGETRQADRFIEHENLSTQVAAVIEGIRKSLADGIASGKVVVAKASKGSDDPIQDERLKHHPGFAIMEVASAADAVIVDDRYMNLHRNISASFGEKPIYTSYDLLTSFHFTEAEQIEFVTALRRSGFCFVPVDADNLGRMLSASPVPDENVVENAELKALRESLLIARMSNSLQLPKQASWLDNVMRGLLDAVRLQWQVGADIVRARARSNWLLELLDIRGWAQRTNPTPQTLISEMRYGALVLSLSLAQGVPQSQRASYWEWLEEALLRQIKEGDAELYQALIAQVRSHIINAINNGAKDA